MKHERAPQGSENCSPGQFRISERLVSPLSIIWGEIYQSMVILVRVSGSDCSSIVASALQLAGPQPMLQEFSKD